MKRAAARSGVRKNVRAAKAQSGHAASDFYDQPLEVEVGQQVRELRHRMDLTVADLSALANLSPGMLSKIENGTVSPSLATLKTLAQALNVPVAHLFREPHTQPICSLVKAGTGARINKRGTKAGHLYNLLVGHSVKQDGGIEPYVITLNEEAAPHTSFRHSGNELIYVLSGRMKYRHAERDYLLEPGDALFFDASVKHGPAEFIERPIKYISILVRPNSAT